MKFLLRNGIRADLEAVLRLNQAEVPHVSTITLEALQALADQARYFTIVEAPAKEIAGFLLGFDEAANYQSSNYQWFKTRYPRFAYVDRIVISRAHQRQGLGKRLYEDVIEKSRTTAPVITCEVNTRPPNPESLEFHRRLGFREVGTQDTEGGKKTVSLLLKDL